MLVDTSGWLCLFHRDEPQYMGAVRLYAAAAKHLTHSYILAEFVALAQARGLPRLLTLEISANMLADENIEVIWVDESLHRQALGLLQARRDKTYSLCDAVSFVLMREREVSESLTTDKHFEQEGYVRLLQP